MFLTPLFLYSRKKSFYAAKYVIHEEFGFSFNFHSINISMFHTRTLLFKKTHVRYFLHFIVNGGYGNWSNFTVCTKSCGSGLKYRNRTCDHPTPMFGGRNCTILGKATEARTCNEHPCPSMKCSQYFS